MDTPSILQIIKPVLMNSLIFFLMMINQRYPIKSNPISLSDSEILSKLSICKKRRKIFFSILITAIYQIISAMTALPILPCVRLIAFYTDDRAQIDRLFRQSALYRPKWDRQTGNTTYGLMTIEKAISTRSATYKPGASFSIQKNNVFDITDYANARRLVDNFGQDLRCVFNGKKPTWFVWSGKCWIENDIRRPSSEGKKNITNNCR